ncbi:UDP-N-acetylmuramate dehydrogenase [Patescibacteria group bacterium]|nr:UDP-N-acetylmuramate dehydrogenase [Patescibacteria group bacterium]
MSLKFKKNILLKNYTTFRIGGPAKYFFEAKTKEDLVKAIEMAKKINLPFFILGGGSNLLIFDEGYDGLVVKVKSQKSKVKSNKIFCEAGVKLSDLVELSLKNSLTGLEWAAGIPKATLGGTIHNNAGAFKVSIADIVKTVEVFDTADSKIKNLDAEQCNFNYKQTIFKQQKNLIILSCILQLKKSTKKAVEEQINYVLNYREKNHPMKFSSAGCIFKNPSEVRAAELVEKCGLKGKKIGDAQISEKHANFIVNLGKASSRDVLKLINLAKKQVKKKFGIKLEEEIYFIKSY